jgi:hypothetical protein
MAIFACADYRPVGNTRGDAISPNLGLVLHHAVANGSLYNQFNSPSSGVSANFWVSQSGIIEQYVDSSVQSWHGMSLNQRYCGVETEGCTKPPYADPMSDVMVAALARLYSEGHARHGWPYQLSNADGVPGFGYHRMAVNTACPCDIRLNRRQDILNIAQGATPSPTPPTQQDNDMIDATPSGKGYFTTTRDGAVYAFGDAVFRGGANEKNTLPAGRTIVGIACCANDGYWLLSSGGDLYSYGSAQYYGKPDRV